MTYELAKKLKDAGLKRINEWTYCDPIDEIIPVPTLSELIESCGECFYGLFRAEKGWICNAYDDAIKGLKMHGTTPEEAVAHLLLELNKK